MNIDDIPSIGFIGGGNMARSIIGGLLAVGLPRESIAVSDPAPEANRLLEELFGIAASSDNAEVADRSEVIVLAVKPQIMQEALDSIRDSIQKRHALLISIAAGIRLSQLDAWSGGGLPIVRTMPNTPALIRQGVTGMYANERVDAAQWKCADAILDAVSETVWFDDEGHLDAVTAVSGSGPAYFFYLIEAMALAGERLGLPAETARSLAVATATGASQLAAQSDQSPGQLRVQVTSPGGTTEQALKVLDSANVKETVVRAIAAAQKRSVELSS